MQLWRLGILKSFDADFNGILMIFFGHVVWLYIYIHIYIYVGVVLPWLDRHAMSFERFQFSYAPICTTYIYIIIIIYILYDLSIYLFHYAAYTWALWIPSLLLGEPCRNSQVAAPWRVRDSATTSSHGTVVPGPSVLPAAWRSGFTLFFVC